MITIITVGVLFNETATWFFASIYMEELNSIVCEWGGHFILPNSPVQSDSSSILPISAIHGWIPSEALLSLLSIFLYFCMPLTP